MNSHVSYNITLRKKTPNHSVMKTFAVMKNPYQSLISSSSAACAFLSFCYAWLQHLDNRSSSSTKYVSMGETLNKSGFVQRESHLSLWGQWCLILQTGQSTKSWAFRISIKTTLNSQWWEKKVHAEIQYHPQSSAVLWDKIHTASPFLHSLNYSPSFSHLFCLIFHVLDTVLQYWSTALPSTIVIQVPYNLFVFCALYF